MVEYDDDVAGPPRAGCVASFLVAIIILFFLAVVLGQSSGTTTAASAPPVVEGNGMVTAVAALPTVFLTHTPSPAASPTLRPTATATFTPTPSNTPTPTPTPTNTPTPTLTNTPPPGATFTPTPTPTFPPPQAGPLPTPNGIYSYTLKVPVLMYHYISIPPEGADIYRTDLSVSPELFRAHMQYLAENGFTPIDLYTLSRAITQHDDLPAKPVIITIDDGYRDNYENGLPILKEFGFTATIFLATNFLDDGHPGYLTWAMVKEMSDAGIQFEPHSKSHSDLSDRGRDFLIYEMLGSQETIAAHIGYTPRYFAYPSGRYDETAMQVLEELGFWGAVTTMGGTWHSYENRFEWKRVRIHNYTTVEDFAKLVSPGGTVGGRYP